MLPSNTWLDHRYRIRREIGGGGQATVYLAEDNRFSGQERAIKELSPNQLSLQDLGWAIPAFQQEAQLLATLIHPGIVRVSNYFEESGKLIDFGIARFFKPGQTYNAVNLGTPGYASPEHGSKGQADPRSDIYSLGVTLHQMATGYDPTNTPFTLPPARSLNLAVSPAIEAAIQRATQLNPAQRFQSAAEFRQELLALTRPIDSGFGPGGTQVISDGGTITNPPQGQRNRWLLIVAVLIIALAGAFLYSQLPKPPLSTPTAAVASLPVQQPGGGRRPTDSSTPSSPTLQPAQPQPQPQSAPVVESTTKSNTPNVVVDDTPLGRSVGGREISMLKAGNPDGPAVFLVGSIEGDQSDTSSIVYQLAEYYRARPAEVPNGGLLYLIPSLNPDGNATDSRYNRNGVDLNRNWDTANWERDAVVPGGRKSGSGGSAPFSEPETRVLRDAINSLLSVGQPVTLVVLHSTVNDSMRDQVFPGYTKSGIHGSSETVTRRVGNVLGYRYNTAWSYDTTGEAIAWAAEQDIPAVDIVPKKNSGPSLLQMIQALADTLR